MKKLVFLAIAVSIFVVSQSVSASNLRWLENSPSSKFTDKDWEIAKASANRALNHLANDEIMVWENPESKNHGRLTPLLTFDNNGKKCRTLKIENFSANGLSGRANYDFCKNDEGLWKVLSKSK